MLDMVDDNVKVDERAIAINANVFNNLLYDIYQYRNYKTCREMIKYLNKKYKTKLEERDIKNILNNEYFIDFMDMMYNKHSKLVSEIRDVQNGNHEACKMEGGNSQPLDIINYDDNVFGKVLDALDNKEFAERDDVKPIIEQIPFFNAYADKDWDGVSKIVSDWIVGLNLDRFIDMIFFPLYYLEQGETFGKYNSIIIDLIGIWLNWLAIFLGFVTPILLKGLTTMLTASATVPGLGTATAPIATALGIAEMPIISLVNSMPMFFKFLMSIQRKDFKRALDYMGLLFPSLGVAMISATNIVTMINKFLLIFADGLEYVDNNITRFKSLIPTDLNNLMSLDVDTGYRNFVQPNIATDPLTKGIVEYTGLDNTMDNFRNKRKRIMDKYNEEEMKQMGAVTRKMIDKQNEIKEKI
jgi:hypothetical protein